VLLGGAPDPGQVADAGVRQDQAGAGELACQLYGVAAQRRDPAPRVHEHRQVALAGEGEDITQGGVVEREALGARVQLDPPSSGLQAALGLGQRLVLRIEPAEGHKATVRGGGLGEHHVVRRLVAAGLLHGEDGGSGVGRLEGGAQLLRRAAVPVRVVPPEVRVYVEKLQTRNFVAYALEPGQRVVVRDQGGAPYPPFP
jgi:hypothetical protein